MNLVKQIKNKRIYLNNHSCCEWDDMNEIMVCASCVQPFRVGDYNVRLEQKGTKFIENIICSNPDCQGEGLESWISPHAGIDIFSKIYKEETNVKEKKFWKSLVSYLKVVVKNQTKQKV